MSALNSSTLGNLLRLLLLFVVASSLPLSLAAQIAKESMPQEETEAPIITPERMGFKSYSVGEDDSQTNYFVSTAGKPLDTSQRLPILVYVQGSGSTPIYYGTKERLGSSLMFDSNDFPDFHFIVISKPGIPFYAEEKEYDSDEYNRRTSLQDRVRSIADVISQVETKPWVDTTQIMLLGHSEGADVAPWAAAEIDAVTHLVVLCPGVVSQMMDFIIQERKKAARGEQTSEAADKEIATLKEQYREIFANPEATDLRWYGHTYKRWSTFFAPSLEAFVQLEIPIYAIVGRDDQNTPCESGEALELEFIRRHKTNLLFEVWPIDHYFVEGSTSENRIDRRSEVPNRIRKWLDSCKTNKVKP